MRILHVDNLALRKYGVLKGRTGRCFLNGMIRNNWKTYEYSDRDIAKFEAPLNIKPLGIGKTNKRFLQTCENFRPDLILMGHADLLKNETLYKVRKLLPGVKIIYVNIDPLWRERNVKVLHWRKEFVDAIFVTTAGEPLQQFCTGKNIVGYIPNATDPSWAELNNSTKNQFEFDLIFCGRGNATDDRYSFLQSVDEKLKQNLRFESYGLYGNPCIYGEGYDRLLENSKMGLNLNRFEGWPLYSSDRIAQLMGNGILTFVWDKGDMRRFFTDEHVAFFKNEEELVRKAIEFQNNDEKRKAVAAAGRAFYHEHFSGQRITKFMIETTLGLPYSHDYLWQNEVYR